MAKKSKGAQAPEPSKGQSKITTSSTAEYFAKNLQQVGFSSQTKAVLTTLKEAVDNALDACEEGRILPEVTAMIEKVGAGSLKNADQIRIRVEDNGPGIEADDLAKVFGEYLASSKFGRGRCSRGQQGIGISAATTWAQLTSAVGAKVISKTKSMRKAVSCLIEVDIKNNRGLVKDRETIDWDRPHGTSVEFLIDGRIQMNGEAGLNNYLMGTALVNPHLKLTYKIQDEPEQVIDRVSETLPEIPSATAPHPHTMKLGEFIAHSHLFGRVKTNVWLKKGFSRVSDLTIKQLQEEAKVSKGLFEKSVDGMSEADFKVLFMGIQNIKLMAPSTQSVLSIGEESLSKSIQRLGKVDFFSVVSRRPTICDYKPVQVEVAVARLEERGVEPDDSVQVLRFANRVPLQFDKSGCAIVQAINSVNWRPYGLQQPKNSLPLGPYIIAVSVVSPFIKFKNASKETIDSSDELVEEIRRALIQAGQRLSRHLNRETKAAELEEKIRHIEQFGPILVEGICRITHAPDSRKKKAEDGLKKLLGRDAQATENQLKEAHQKLEEHLAERGPAGGAILADSDDDEQKAEEALGEEVDEKPVSPKKSGKKSKDKGAAQLELPIGGSPKQAQDKKKKSKRAGLSLSPVE